MSFAQKFPKASANFASTMNVAKSMPNAAATNAVGAVSKSYKTLGANSFGEAVGNGLGTAAYGAASYSIKGGAYAADKIGYAAGATASGWAKANTASKGYLNASAIGMGAGAAMGGAYGGLSDNGSFMGGMLGGAALGAGIGAAGKFVKTSYFTDAVEAATP